MLHVIGWKTSRNLLNFFSDKAKPAERQGRKATGLTSFEKSWKTPLRTAGLPGRQYLNYFSKGKRVMRLVFKQQGTIK